MAQASPRFCSNCGTPAAPEQRFCSNCGAVIDAGSANPTARASSSDDYQNDATIAPTPKVDVPPPPPPTYYPPQPAQNFPPPQQQVPSFQQPPPAGQKLPQPQPVQTYQQPPAYAKPQKDSSRSVLGQIGCGVVVVIVLVLAICGAAGYFGWQFVSGLGSKAINSANSTATADAVSANATATALSITPGTTPGVTPTLPPVVTVTLNAQIVYKSAQITLGTVKEGVSASFPDDDRTSADSPYIVRINMKEVNQTTTSIFGFYFDSLRLVLQDGTNVAPLNILAQNGLDQQTSRDNWVDFPLKASVDLSKTTLLVGVAKEAQIKVPLIANPDVSKYQDKTISPNTTFQYAGLKWTLTSVLSSLSENGNQADSGKRFITVSLTVDNPTADTFYLFPGNNTRLKSGTLTNAPVDSKFDAIAANSTGSTGTITFPAPQDISTFTLIFLAQPSSSIAQTTVNFQI